MYHMTSNIRLNILHIFSPVEKLRYVLNSSNIHLSDIFPKTPIQKLDMS
jgi:hypothetical protein